MKNSFLLFLIITVFNSSCKDEKIEPIRTGSLEGVILNEYNQPIEGASIVVQDQNITSNSLGRYFIEDLPAGQHQVIVSKEFYLTKLQNVIITHTEKSNLDFILSPGVPYLFISDSTKIVSPDAGSFEILVESNSAWLVRSSSTVVCSTLSGEGNGKVQFSWVANKEFNDIYDTIEFVSGNIIKYFFLTRAAPIALLEVEGIPGNKVKGISDSVYILFNKPIVVSKITSNNTFCVSGINFNLVNNDCGIMFSYNCAKVGGSFPFTITVSDLNGFNKTLDFEVPFFKSRVHFEGYLQNYQLINDEKEILIATAFPSRILRYSIDKDTITHIYDLSTKIIPYRIAYNPYNHKVYITGADPGTIPDFLFHPDMPYFFTLDIRNGEIAKSEIIKPRMSYSHLYNDNKPFYFGFTKSGYGIIHFDYHWELIDSSNNDSLFLFMNGDYDFNETTLLRDFYPNRDSTKLWITRTNYACNYTVFDGNNQSFSFVPSPHITRSSFLSPNRVNDNVFVGQILAQFIMDSSGNQLGQMSYSSGHDLYGSDFTYRENSESQIYYMGATYIDLRDYATAETLVRFDKQYGVGWITTSRDGKYIISMKGGNYNSANILVFETKYFYRN